MRDRERERERERELSKPDRPSLTNQVHSAQSLPQTQTAAQLITIYTVLQPIGSSVPYSQQPTTAPKPQPTQFSCLHTAIQLHYIKTCDRWPHCNGSTQFLLLHNLANSSALAAVSHAVLQYSLQHLTTDGDTNSCIFLHHTVQGSESTSSSRTTCCPLNLHP